MQIRPYRDEDWSEYLRMSVALFPDYSASDLAKGMKEFRARPDAEVFLAERGDGSIAGFVEVGSRPYADGCKTGPSGTAEPGTADPNLGGGDTGGGLCRVPGIGVGIPASRRWLRVAWLANESVNAH